MGSYTGSREDPYASIDDLPHTAAQPNSRPVHAPPPTARSLQVHPGVWGEKGRKSLTGRGGSDKLCS